MQFDSSFTRIVIDGTKYQRIGSQKVRINNLSADDAVPHVCRAEGVRDKTINVYIERSKYCRYSIDELLCVQYSNAS